VAVTKDFVFAYDYGIGITADRGTKYRYLSCTVTCLKIDVLDDGLVYISWTYDSTGFDDLPLWFAIYVDGELRDITQSSEYFLSDLNIGQTYQIDVFVIIGSWDTYDTTYITDALKNKISVSFTPSISSSVKYYMVKIDGTAVAYIGTDGNEI
jgi:hypothetical protein